MRSGLLNRYATILLLNSIVLLAGCASSYISPELAGIPTKSLSKIVGRNTGGFPVFAVDGVGFQYNWWAKPDVYITPGKHEVWYTYKRYVMEYGTWKESKEEVHAPGGTIITTTYRGYRPVGRSEIGKCTLTFEAGQRYNKYRLTSMLNAAGCKTVIEAK
jgi:hypothetical protein